jgi:hypothetical protein
MLSSGKTSLLSDPLRKQLSILKKEQDLLYLISDHMIADAKTNLHEIEKYWNMENSSYFKTAAPQRSVQFEMYDGIDRIKSDELLLNGLKFHHNIFNWTYKSIYFHEERGSKIKNQSEEIVAQINSEINN